MGLSGNVVMPSDVRRSGRRSLEKPSREWKAIRRAANEKKTNEKKTNEQAAIGKLPFGKKGRPPGRRVGKSTWEKMRLGMETLERKRRSEERLVLPGTARGSGRAPLGLRS